MAKKLVTGSLLGGLVLFAWTAVSWMVMPWHTKSFSTFTDESAVARAITKSAPNSGVYLLPNMYAAIAAAPADQKKAVEEKCQETMKAGPSGFLVVHLGGMDMKAVMPRMMLRGFVIQAASCLAVTWIVLQAASAGFLARLVLAVVAGAGGIVVAHLNYWNWWGFAGNYTCTEGCDALAGWVLAGLVLAKVTGKRRKR